MQAGSLLDIHTTVTPASFRVLIFALGITLFSWYLAVNRNTTAIISESQFTNISKNYISQIQWQYTRILLQSSSFWSLSLSKRVLQWNWISYWAPNIRWRFNQKYLLRNSWLCVFMTKNCFFIRISNCSLDFLSTWGDRNTVYKTRDSGNLIFRASAGIPEIVFPGTRSSKDRIAMHILVVIAFGGLSSWCPEIHKITKTISPKKIPLCMKWSPSRIHKQMKL